MKKLYLLAAAILLAFTPDNHINGLGPLQQLAGGTWKIKTAKGYTCEQWKITGDNELSGRSFRIQGTDTVVTEEVQLIKKGIEVYYIPTVKGQNNGQPIPFKLTSAYKGTYMFTNPDHDYPQIVAYQFVSKDSINAWIDGKLNGEQKRVDFHYKRITDRWF